MKKNLLNKLFVLVFIVGVICTLSIFKNRAVYEQSEVTQTLKALGLAEESYYEQSKKYTDRSNELGISFSSLSNISIHFSTENLPINIKLSNDNIPYVSRDFYRVIALFKTSHGKLQIWKLEKGNKIQLLQTI